MHEQRSAGLIVSVLACLGLGTIFAYSLPAISGGFWGGVKLTQLAAVIEIFSDKGWLIGLGRLGVIAAAVSAIAFPPSQRVLQAWCVTLGSLAPMPLVLWLWGELGSGEDGSSLGSGAILASLCFIASAVIPWVFVAHQSPQPKSSTGEGYRPGWMSHDR